MPTILQSLRTHWKYRGAGRSLLLATRKILQPIVMWDVHYVFHRPLKSHSSPPPSQAGMTILLLKSEADLNRAPGLVAMCPTAAQRLRQGEVAVVALENSDEHEPTVAGYTWITFCDSWLPELDLNMIVRPGEMIHYDSYVSGPYRGRGLHTILVQMAKYYALSTGCTHSLSWISMLNSQSLKTAKRLVREPDKPIIVLSFKLRGMTRFRNVALQGSLSSRFAGNQQARVKQVAA